MNSKRTVYAGNIAIGGPNPVIIQSMVNKHLDDSGKILEHIDILKEAGCQLIRIAYPSSEFKRDFSYIVKHSSMPVIADIHFDYKLAIEAIEIGAAKIRINPGNIKKRNLKQIIHVAKSASTPIRIGVNSGSLESDMLKKYHHPVPDALVESALNSIEFFRENDFEDIVVSIKSSDVKFMYESNLKLAEKCDFPIHLGVTEAGGMMRGSIKNAAGISSLLLNHVGDTIRVSLSADPIEEIKVAKIILKSLHLYNGAPDVIACPTCSRTTFDVIQIQEEVEKILEHSKKNITIAVMGCVVNGPGEAREADLGITGTPVNCILFKQGKIIFSGTKEEVMDKLVKEVELYEEN